MGFAGWSRAAVGARVVFAATGVLAATWAASIPATAERLRLSEGGVALAALCVEGGATLGLPVGAAVVARRGARWAARLGFACYGGALALAALAPSLGSLAVVLAVWAGANSVVDVAMNAAGADLEARAGHPALAGLHAAQSFGLLAGGLVVTGAIGRGVAQPVLFGAVAAAGTAAVVAATAMLPPDARGGPGPVFARSDRRLAALGALAFCGFLIDGAATNWSGFELRAVHGAGVSLAAAGYTALTLASALTRLAGDRLVARLGRRRVLRGCGVACLAGTAVVVLAPTAVVAVMGWALVGAGFALVAPVVVAACPPVGGRRSTAIAAVTTVGYLGAFTGPPLVGLVAALVTLPAALGVVALAGSAVVALAPRVVDGDD